MAPAPLSRTPTPPPLPRPALPKARRPVATGLGAATAADLAGSAAATAPVPDAVRLLVSRATYGATPALLAEVTQTGTAAWLAAQLDPLHQVPDTTMDALLTRWPSQQQSIWQVRAQNAGWDVMFDLCDTHTARAIWSRRQLLEVMVDLWSNHLNATCPSDNVWDNRHRYDLDAIRPNALGTFTALLTAAAKHPAMLGYLGNRDSTWQAPNENQGRELLELHTVGVDAGYTETDVHNSALILTGLAIDDEGGVYEYKPWRHYVGPVQVMGFSHPNPTAEGGASVANAYLSYLAHHPSTARQVATRLATHFVSDTPSAGLVSTLANTYLANGTAIRPVLLALFGSAEFAASAGQKTKRPYEDLISTCRAIGLQPGATGTEGIRNLYYLASTLGQPPMGWAPPNGYPDVTAAWASANGALGRWNVHTALTEQWWNDVLAYPDLTGWATPLPATYGGLADRVAQRLGLKPLPTASRAAVCGFFGKAPADTLLGTDEVIVWRWTQFVCLLLDSPAFASR